MIRSLLARLVGRSGATEGGTGQDAVADHGTDESDGGFTPSRLDASVLESHGMGSAEAERELASIEEQARVHEDYHPDE